eukprot:1541006-Rhodomonas_salina.2
MHAACVFLEVDGLFTAGQLTAMAGSMRGLELLALAVESFASMGPPAVVVRDAFSNPHWLGASQELTRHRWFLTKRAAPCPCCSATLKPKYRKWEFAQHFVD